MRKLSAILFITLFALLCLFGCNPSSPGNNDNANDTTDTTDKTDNDDWTYTNAHYANPLKFYKQDGSEYFVTVADPDILRDDESGYFFICTAPTLNAKWATKGYCTTEDLFSEAKTLWIGRGLEACSTDTTTR